MSYAQHEQTARHERPSIRCGVVTISDTRTEADDASGDYIRQALVNGGHQIVRSAIVKDEPQQIVTLVRELVDAGCQVIITSGGTGIAKRDSTFEAVDALLQKRLPGFGEIFRMLSFNEIGPAAILSRATAGTFGETLIFCLPGSPNAAQVAMDKLIVPELNHLVWEIFRQKG